MGKARTAVASKKQEGEEKPSSTNTGLGRRKQPNVASAGLAFLTASGYFPLPLQTPSTSASSVITIDNKNFSSSSSAPLHEFITSWESRSEACQVMREQNTMTNGVSRKNQQQSKTKTTKAKQDQNNTNNKSEDLLENEDSSTTTANNQVQNIGSAKVNWELLLKMRNWLLSVLVNESNRVTVVGENTRETVRSLLLGIPLTNPVILDDAAPAAVDVPDNESTEISRTKNENEGEQKSEDAAVPVEEDEEASSKPSPRKSHQQKSNEEIQKKLDFISECDWPTLVGIARKQIEEVMDPFLKKHGVLL